MNLSYTVEQLGVVVSSSNSWKEVLDRLGLYYTTKTLNRVRVEANNNNIGYEHFIGKGISNKYSLEDILVKNSPYPKNSSYRLKKTLWDRGILEKRCKLCGIEDFWNGNSGIDHLEIDHIDGDGSNNSIENLRILCSNCHSYTDTNCGRNIGRKN